MKKILTILTLILFAFVFLAGCSSDENTQLKQENEQLIQENAQLHQIIEQYEAIEPELELQRYRVEIVEVVDNDHYIVSKTGYAVGGIYYLTTNNENLEAGDTVYVIVTDKYNCRLFTEYIDSANG
jgi:molybdopterin converting factor small subunit